MAGNAVKLQRIKQNSPDSPPYPANYANSAHFAQKLTRMLLTFRSLTIAREPREIGANRQDSAQFAPLLRELREFHAFRSRLTHV